MRYAFVSNLHDAHLLVDDRCSRSVIKVKSVTLLPIAMTIDENSKSRTTQQRNKSVEINGEGLNLSNYPRKVNHLDELDEDIEEIERRLFRFKKLKGMHLHTFFYSRRLIILVNLMLITSSVTHSSIWIIVINKHRTMISIYNIAYFWRFFERERRKKV